jgi:hypothetical protein
MSLSVYHRKGTITGTDKSTGTRTPGVEVRKSSDVPTAKEEPNSIWGLPD